MQSVADTYQIMIEVARFAWVNSDVCKKGCRQGTTGCRVKGLFFSASATNTKAVVKTKGAEQVKPPQRISQV
jgi:hypothetical protein